MCRNVVTTNLVSTAVDEVSEQEIPLATIEIRGGLIERWEAREGFTIVSEEDDEFEDQDLSSGDWCEFAERMSTVVGVYDLTTSVGEGFTIVSEEDDEFEDQ
eukprot:CAMPEP_0204896564 /NCGR_PEP_ID=MMETSP1397-20131031/235_1 /ASSEMBLY_ACC=CAM_ASM_000891 /TAXON_ID=49980 /ORGANISM="Climacostomum Climacostomum virens, Strain Stock W-24" /LENGTH=101 /DNA_ID=CAMNT_0052064189 /DNA_START=558 /DNA_END=861 /DNA_ORIENTATION=-